MKRAVLLFPLLSLLVAASRQRLTGEMPFSRGDANADARLDLTDAVFALRFLFLAGAPAPPCDDALDADDSGALELTDPVYTLNFLFRSGPALPPPAFPACGGDPTPDPLGCARFQPCAEPAPGVLLFANPALPLEAAPGEIAAGDLDQDGDVDLLAALPDSDDVAVFINERSGVFAPYQPWNFGAGSMRSVAIAAGDLDGDGDLDIAAGLRSTTGGAGRLGVLHNLGDALFSPAVGPEIGRAGDTLVLADLDGDGAPDAVLTDALADTVLALHNRGDGSFLPGEPHDVRMRARFLAAGDADGDGAVDIAVTNGTSPVITVLYGHGDGRLEDSRSVATGGGAAGGVAIGDAGGDAIPDLVFASPQGVSVLRGAGGRAFAGPVDHPVHPIRSSLDPPREILLEDLDADGRLDVVALILEYPSFASVVLNRGEGRFSEPALYPAGRRGVAAALADFDGDGLVDLATSDWSVVFVRLGAGGGRFADPHVDTGIDEGRGVAVADLDGDGRPDLAVAGGEADSRSDPVAVLVNRGGGRFDLSRVPAGDEGESVVAGDLDGDGDTDLAVASRRPGTVTILVSSGTGSFQGRGLLVPATALAAGDADGDGDLDLAVASRVEGVVTLLLNQGSGVFLRGETVAAGPRPGRLELADLDADGRLDLAVPSGATVLVLRGRGGGGFGAPESHEVAGEASSVTAADTEGDGDLDLVIAGERPPGRGRITVLLNHGNVFGGAATYDLETAAAAVASADLDGDGAADLAVTSPSQGILTVLLNRAGGRYVRHGSYEAGDGAASVAAADLDGDAATDLVVASSNGVSVLLRRPLP